MQSLIDGDLVAYRTAVSCEKRDNEGSLLSLEPIEIAIDRCDKLMRQLLEETNADTHRTFLTGTSNFRKELDEAYKANRKDKPEPVWLQNCREFLVGEWHAEVQDNIEADDALGISQNESSVVVSLDKDLLQIPGRHYQWQIEGGPTEKRWVKEAKWYDISDIDGLRNFYTQTLVGDKSDNIYGVYGIGPAKAKRLLEALNDEKAMFDACRALYKDDNRYFLNLKLLYIMREENDIFDSVKRGLIDAVD